MPYQLIAHRGASGNYPENTLLAVRAAYDLGCPAVEVDLQLTADEQVVVLHDPTTGRTCDADLVVRDTTWSDLRKLKISAPGQPLQRIPHLSDVLAVANGRTVFLELKCGLEAVPAVVEQIERVDYLTRDGISLISFAEPVLVELKQQLPDVPALLVAYGHPGAHNPAEPSVDELIERVVELGLDGLDLHREAPLAKRHVEHLHALALSCFVWTVDDPAEAASWQRKGVDGVATNYPERMLEAR